MTNPPLILLARPQFGFLPFFDFKRFIAALRLALVGNYGAATWACWPTKGHEDAEL
jgi:hypothetical protein